MSDDINAAVTSAVAEATKEVEAPAPAAEPEPAAAEPEAPAEPVPAPAPEPKEAPAEEEFWTPTAEELDAINKSPELKKVYRSMQKGLTQKSMQLADLRKQTEERAKIADWIQSDPETAIRAIATATGVTLAEAKKASETTVVDSLEAKWAQTVGPEAAKLLRPLFEETAKTMLEQTIAPLRQQTEEMARAAQERGIAASVREFGASVVERGDEWDDTIQAEMAKLANVVAPGEETSIQDFLGTLYDTVYARRARQRTAKENLARLRRVKEEQEPTTTVRPGPKSEESITSDMSEKDAIALAVRQSKKELGLR